MALIKECRGKTPTHGNDCWFAENATIVGDVTMGDQCSVWFNSVIRGDVNSIQMGDKVNIQDGAVIHCTFEKTKTVLGNNVSIGHNALVHGCTVEDNVLIGMGSIVMDDCYIDREVLSQLERFFWKGRKLEKVRFGQGFLLKRSRTFHLSFLKEKLCELRIIT